MNHTPAPRDDFRPGPLGLWALGLAGATRSRWRDEVVMTDEDEGSLRENVPVDETMSDPEHECVVDCS